MCFRYRNSKSIVLLLIRSFDIKSIAIDVFLNYLSNCERQKQSKSEVFIMPCKKTQIQPEQLISDIAQEQVQDLVDNESSLVDNEPNSEHNEIEQPVTELGQLTTSEQAKSLDQPQDETNQFELQVNSELLIQGQRLNKLSRVSALILADENLEDFKQIYQHRYNVGLNTFLNDMAGFVQAAVDRVRESDTRDFLNEMGKSQTTTSQKVQEHLDRIINLI